MGAWGRQRSLACALLGAASVVVAQPVPAPAAPESGWSGDLAFGLQLSGSTYISRRTTADADVAYRQGRYQFLGELAFDREVVKVEGQPLEVDRDRYDVNLKVRRYLDDPAVFLFVSPRFRHNANGYYVTTRALRLGGGWVARPRDTLTLTLEGATGYRTAGLQGGGRVNEALWGARAQLRWQLSESVQLRANLAHEQSALERYRTVDLGLRTKLSAHLGVLVKASYERGYPFSSTDRSAETELDVSLSYAL